jgi:PAP_fibrillin
MVSGVNVACGVRLCPFTVRPDRRPGRTPVDLSLFSPVTSRRRLSRHQGQCQAVFGLFDRVKQSSKASNAKVDQLISLAEETQLGTKTDPTTKKELLRLVDELQEAQSGAVTTDSRINATWKLLWTTEKETLFIIQTAWLFGTKAGGVYQVNFACL